MVVCLQALSYSRKRTFPKIKSNSNIDWMTVRIVHRCEDQCISYTCPAIDWQSIRGSPHLWSKSAGIGSSSPLKLRQTIQKKNPGVWKVRIWKNKTKKSSWRHLLVGWWQLPALLLISWLPTACHNLMAKLPLKITLTYKASSYKCVYIKLQSRRENKMSRIQLLN